MTTANDQQMRAVRPSGPHKARLRFERLPAAWCHPDRLAGLLPQGLPAGFQGRLQGSPRLRLRLSALLTRRFALEPLGARDLATPEGRFARLEGEALQSALRRIGAIWHARALRNVILQDELRRLIERLGRGNHRAGLRRTDLAPSDDRESEDAADDAPDVDTLIARIERDGLLALNAWCCLQPASLAARLRLKLPPCSEADDEPPASHREHGPRIVDAVVAMLAAEAEARG
ncbi:MAG: SctK family type III secretion system sorting platform protein [Alphaproteobacteria bacterium]